MRSAPRFISLSLLLCAGCSANNFTPTGATITAGAATSPPYHAYGDSITAGYALADPLHDAYPVLLADAKTLLLTDLAISGDQACDVPTRQIFPAAESPTTATPTVYTLLISTNDVDIKSSGPYEAIFNLCQQATLAWLATPIQAKLLATAATVTTSGATHLDSASGFNAVFTDTAAASVTLPFQRTGAGAVYLWYRIMDGSSGAFNVSLDGSAVTALTTGTIPTISTQNGTGNSLALLRIPSVAAGSHTLTLTQTSTGASGLGVVAIGFPPVTRPAGSPRVLVGTTPMQYNGYPAACNSPSAPNCLAYIADITANATLLASDGLDVELFNTRKYMTGTAADMADQVHPNATGHQEIFKAITDIY